jgi:molybdopterin molybdotransferase
VGRADATPRRGGKPQRCEDSAVAELISIAEARRRVLEAVDPLSSEAVPLEETLGRVLAEEVRSTIDVPPFDNSAMDGFAIVSGPAAELRVVGEARAGHPSPDRVKEGTAVRISTGAPVPEGADAVVPVERIETMDGVVRVPVTDPGANVRRAGEDVRAGDTVLHPGVTLGAAEVGVLASLGRIEALCAARPRVALLLTGDELVEPGEPLPPGRIWSSNGHALTGQIDRAGGELVERVSVPDSAERTREALGGALERADFVCISGGVSVGPHDHVKDELRALGVQESFWGVSLKPGKPTWFGRGERALVLGVPGNPVSAMVTFHLFGRPALRALQGADPGEVGATAVLDEAIARNPRREQAVRCRLRAADDGWHAAPTGNQASHVLTSMLGADALALVPPGEGELGAGERLEIEVL